MKKLVVSAFAVVGLLLVTYNNSLAQDKMKQIYIQAQAMGEAQQLGRNFSVTMIIEELSTPDDQKALMEAFQAKGNAAFFRNRLLKRRKRTCMDLPIPSKG